MRPAFDLQDGYDRYRSEGGRGSFAAWSRGMDDRYGCNAEWLVEDYLRVVRKCEDDNATTSSFRLWLESQPQDYRDAHIDQEVDA